MELSSRSEHALLVLLYLARQDAGRHVTVEAIGSTQRIPPGLLEPILHALEGARYVRSQQGQQAGYRLAKRPCDITIAEVIRIFDGALAPTDSVSRYFFEPTALEQEKNLIRLFKQICKYVSGKLERTTLADLR
ncbi:MAG: Rrf2 family transcriptional regulator [Acidobacteria bacterium]|nr:Rrf2 family transcriptional regulator [Acidobacteriota bacterium]